MVTMVMAKLKSEKKKSVRANGPGSCLDISTLDQLVQVYLQNALAPTTQRSYGPLLNILSSRKNNPFPPLL